jgi:glycosyltransferase involved in cell wall biosynthesis
MPDVYFATSVLAVTSDNEGTNVSAIEAQASGVPIVTTRVGGMPSVVGDGETGFVVPAEREDVFADRVASLLCDEPLHRGFAEAGAHAARANFALERLVDNVVGLYRRLLDSHVHA